MTSFAPKQKFDRKRNVGPFDNIYVVITNAYLYFLFLQLFILLFLLAKRHIMRVALRSARKPHVSIGTDAPKVYQQRWIIKPGVHIE